jgi:nickel-dependent lactate racemase
MSLYLAKGSRDLEISPTESRSLLFEAPGKLGERVHVLAVPPDVTRKDSRAGELTHYIYEYDGNRLEAVLPALGTHAAMSPAQLSSMFGNVPHELLRVHNWRTDAETLGEVPASFVHEQSEGKLNYAWPAQVNRLIAQGGFDLVLSLGQVVPHEVAGMASYNKNILIGTGGRDSINRSHYLGQSTVRSAPWAAQKTPCAVFSTMLLTAS